MASPTTNKGYTYPTHGGAVNAWDTPLNDNFDQIDLNVGGVYPITATTTTVAITFSASFATVPSTATSITPNSSIAQNFAIRISGTISSTMTILLPAAGGFYVIDNQTTTGTLKANTTSGTSAVTIATGGNNLIYTSSVNSNSANIVGQFQAKVLSNTGTPVSTLTPVSFSQVTGGLTDAVWDGTNRQLYFATSSQSSAWVQTNPRTIPEGYLTLSTDANNPITSSDYASKTAVYYSPLYGNWAVLSNGTVTFPYQFSQLALSLVSGTHTSSNIYDVFLFNSSAGVMIGTGPAWSTVTAGAGARGSGAGTTELGRLNGYWTNANSITLTNGSTSFTCGTNQGLYLGSIYMDATAGQVTCHRSYGQNRKWGVWNNYNRQKLYLIAGDATASWTYFGTPVRAINNSTGNSVTTFCGLKEEVITAAYDQTVDGENTSASIRWQNGIGVNSITAVTGYAPEFAYNVSGSGVTFQGAWPQHSKCSVAPSLGTNVITALEASLTANTFTPSGGEDDCRLEATWRG